MLPIWFFLTARLVCHSRASSLRLHSKKKSKELWKVPKLRTQKIRTSQDRTWHPNILTCSHGWGHRVRVIFIVLPRHLISVQQIQMANQTPTSSSDLAKQKSKTGTNTSPNNWIQCLEGQWPSQLRCIVFSALAAAVFLKDWWKWGARGGVS